MAESESARYRALVLGHGALVIAVGLVAGFGLLFSLLGEVAIWPLPGIDTEVPGSERGWSAAHVGGILNGVMMIAVALSMPHLGLGERATKWVAWAMIYTGWANTVFYLFGNLAANRGLSGGANRLGEGSAAGLIAYVPAAIATLITIAAMVAVARAAFAKAKEV